MKSYHIESNYCDKWLKIMDGGLSFLRGFLFARKDASPRLAYRIMRNDGKIMDEICSKEDVSVGQVAGWPTAEQYEHAAARALEKAKFIRETC